jgi:hypothetical protein
MAPPETQESYPLEDLSQKTLSAPSMQAHSAADEYGDSHVDEFLEQHQSYLTKGTAAPEKYAKQRLWTSFFFFGLLNNVLYVIILSAALDLVPAKTPKGVVAFFNIFPALIAKAVWPYVSKGEIRYRKRVYCCTVCSLIGMVVSTSYGRRYRLLILIAAIKLPAESFNIVLPIRSSDSRSSQLSTRQLCD